ncbi:transposase IS3 [Advenella kashmirensis W13003]|uniref:Transposase IS3 n=1 Tax=Advenella kashmirensis W13003 TaxID=1424334 RepID=V8QNI3_9BURK|nr:transposase [Advenella kashmirensis]ETF00529.1 transposase IS3 [Advenella kashmirensis W13003]
MQTNELVPQEGRRHRRQFSSQAKADIVAECQQRGVSVAAVARAHDLHPNLLRKWVQTHERFGSDEAVLEPAVHRDVAAQFIPLQLTRPKTPEVPAQMTDDIRIELQHNGIKASVRWPISQTQQCAAWLREVMR